MENSSNISLGEIIMGIASPIGTNIDHFKERLTDLLKINKILLININVTDELLGPKSKNKDNDLPKSLKYYLKMQICTHLRDKYTKGILIHSIVSTIRRERAKIETPNKYEAVVYLVDQLKNVSEYKILKHIYGKNYIQISLFSSERIRDETLEKIFEEDNNFDIESENNKIKDIIKNKYLIEINEIEEHLERGGDKFDDNKIDDCLRSYRTEILKDASHMLILKDFSETDLTLSDKESGQQVADLYHLSNYFINLNLHHKFIDSEINKFIDLLLGKYKEYPTQDEFGMSLAYQASVRSNFPGKRHVGAALISQWGEVISVASVRAPSGSSNTSLYDEQKINTGFEKYKNKIDSWKKFIEEQSNDEKFKEIKKFISNVLDFHPCTHAEIAAVLDAAKLGVSIRNATLYSTTYPCHLCAKDILNAGISEVVYLEAYPKSKNKELYPDLIDTDPKIVSELIPFKAYIGIGPKAYYYAYSVHNHTKNPEWGFPILQFVRSEYYESLEKDVLEHIENIIKNGNTNCKLKKCNKNFLCRLFVSQDK